MAKIYVLSPREGMDFSKAKIHGDLVEVGKGMNPTNFEHASEIARDLVADMGDTDMVMPMATLSSSVIMAYIFKELATTDIFGGKVDVLIFNAKEEVYRKRTINL